MKGKIWGILLIICMLGLTACASSKQVNKTESATMIQESIEETQDDTTQTTDGTEQTDIVDLQETEFKHITIDLSTVKEFHPEGDTVTPLKWNIVSEKKDEKFYFADEWYEERNMSLPMYGKGWNYFYDDLYEYNWPGDCLEIYEKETGNLLYTLEYPTDKWYVNGNNACLIDGIFYGASIMNGYAQPDTCFMFAYDLNNDKLLWRSADQSYNTMNFIVKDDIIICGYGFTDENDYLYQINRYTGEIIDTLPLKKMPDLLVEQDGKLYVHAYDCEYCIEFE